jgi:hypothetical protein
MRHSRQKRTYNAGNNVSRYLERKMTAFDIGLCTVPGILSEVKPSFNTRSTANQQSVRKYHPCRKQITMPQQIVFDVYDSGEFLPAKNHWA